MQYFDWNTFTKNKIVIHVKNIQEVEAFENWVRLNSKDILPEGFSIYGDKTCYRYDLEHNLIVFADKEYYKFQNYDIFEWSKISSLIEGDTKIVINVNSEKRKVVAIKYKNNKEIAAGIARCNPSDEFDLDRGVNIAIARLKDPNYTPNFEVEDKLKEVIEYFSSFQF